MPCPGMVEQYCMKSDVSRSISLLKQQKRKTRSRYSKKKERGRRSRQKIQRESDREKLGRGERCCNGSNAM